MLVLRLWSASSPAFLRRVFDPANLDIHLLRVSFQAEATAKIEDKRAIAFRPTGVAWFDSEQPEWHMSGIVGRCLYDELGGLE